MSLRFAILTVVLVSPIAGCRATIGHRPGPSHTVVSKKVVEKPYDELWGRAVSWFAGRNITIEKIEKPSGLITAKYRLVMTDRELDAGEVTANGTPMKVNLFRDATLNVLLRPLGETRTEVTCNLFGSFEAFSVASKASMIPPRLLWRGKCESTGALEMDFFAHIEHGQ